MEGLSERIQQPQSAKLSPCAVCQGTTSSGSFFPATTVLRVNEWHCKEERFTGQEEIPSSRSMDCSGILVCSVENGDSLLNQINLMDTITEK